MIKIAIFYQKESKLLDDIRKKIRKEACQSDNVYAIYEYSTIDAFRKANEETEIFVLKGKHSGKYGRLSSERGI